MRNHFIWSWDGTNSAEENMVRDRRMLEANREPSPQTPQIRFYSWSFPSITVGYSQKPKEWVNLIRAHELGIEVVHRPTGGGIVFHQRDLTWSICGLQEAFVGARRRLAPTIQEYYQTIHQAVAAGLRKRFGLPVYLASCKDVGAAHAPPLQCDSSPSFCFAVPVGYDIMASNRKLVGGAIRWTKRGVLYQGTLPMARDFLLLKEIVLSHRRSWLNSLMASSSSLTELGGDEWQYQDLIEAILDGFRNELGWELEEDPSNEMRHVWAGNRRG